MQFSTWLFVAESVILNGLDVRKMIWKRRSLYNKVRGRQVWLNMQQLRDDSEKYNSVKVKSRNLNFSWRTPGG